MSFKSTPDAEAPVRGRTHVRITARRSWFDFGLSEMWQFRGMIRILAVRDVKLRYRQTALGVAGVIIGPLLTAGVLSFVFGEVANLPSGDVPYIAFAFAGFLGWNVFASVFGRSSGALLGDSSLVSRIFVPRLLLPLAGTLVALVDFCISSLLMATIMIVYGVAPGIEIMWAPLWLGLLVTIGLGLGVVLAAFVVHYRDVGVMASTGLQALMYLTPVAYSSSAVPDRFRQLYELNPIAAVIEGLRWSLVGTDPPTVGRVAWSVVACVGTLFVGCAIFTRMERGLADVI